jgi:hypothetical protein
MLRELLERAATGTGPDEDPCRTVVQATRPADVSDAGQESRPASR